MVNPFENFTNWLSTYIHSPWAVALITAALILVLTFFASIAVTKILRSLLVRGKTHIPAMTIYLNIARIVVWALGIAVLLAVCFNIDVTGLVAGLGLGGLAISLGFKDTIANLISGVQITSSKILEPGDYIEVGKYAGIVDDTSWRHTIIKNFKGETVVVPNSIVNSTCVVKKKDLSFVTVSVSVALDNKIILMKNDEAVDCISDAIDPIAKQSKAPKISLTQITDNNVNGVITCFFTKPLDMDTVGLVKDKVVSCFLEK